MSSTASMVTFEARVESFRAIAKPKSKAKPPFPLAAAAYPNLTPVNLATAGFFHDPAEDEEGWDTCKCFVCGLKLGGWDEGDDPFEEHVKRGSCAWAEFVCRPKLHRAMGTELVWTSEESLPSSARSSAWREATYLKAWPHKQKQGWLPTVKKLSQAGFVYNASAASKDAVMCPLCEYSVEGWEATDDPWSIHLNKSPGCLFFTAHVEGGSFIQRTISADAVKKTKRTRKTEAVDPPSDAPTGTEDEVEASASRAKPRKTATRTRGKKKADDDVELQIVAEAETAETKVSEVEPVAQPKKKRGRPKKVKDADLESQTESAVESQAESGIMSHVESGVESQAESQAESSKSSRTKGRKTITSKSRSQRPEPPSDAPSASEAEPEFVDTIVALPDDDEPSSRSKSSSAKSRRQSKKSIAAGRRTVTPIDDIGTASGTDYATTGDEMSQASDGSRRSRRQTVVSSKSRAVDAEGVEKAPPSLGKSTSSRSRSTKKSADTPIVSEADSVLGTGASEAESSSAPLRVSKPKSTSTRRQTIKSKSSQSTASSKPSKSSKSSEASRSAPRSGAESVDEDVAVNGAVDEPLQAAPGTMKKSTTSRKTKAPPAPPAPPAPLAQPAPPAPRSPPVLSQLDRFANIPPSSPMLVPAIEDEPTPRPKSKPTDLPREQQDKSLDKGAKDAKRVMEDVILNLPSTVVGQLTEEQRGMTLEQLVRREFEVQHAAMRRDGEGLISQWETRATEARRRIEML